MKICPGNVNKINNMCFALSRMIDPLSVPVTQMKKDRLNVLTNRFLFLYFLLDLD